MGQWHLGAGSSCRSRPVAIVKVCEALSKYSGTMAVPFPGPPPVVLHIVSGFGWTASCTGLAESASVVVRLGGRSVDVGDPGGVPGSLVEVVSNVLMAVVVGGS